jgi:hypothetical protein
VPHPRPALPLLQLPHGAKHCCHLGCPAKQPLLPYYGRPDQLLLMLLLLWSWALWCWCWCVASGAACWAAARLLQGAAQAP